MINFLAHTYHHFIFILLVINAGALLLTILHRRKTTLMADKSVWLMLFAVVILSFALRYGFSPRLPQVISDEFYYLSTAENIAQKGITAPFIPKGFPPAPEPVEGFKPPYPQGWPAILSLYFRFSGSCSFEAASDFSLILSSITPVFVFFAAFFLLENLGQNPEKQKQSAVLCGLFASLIWAVLPPVIKTSGTGSLETASALYLWGMLAALFYYYRHPSPAAFWLFASSFSLCINMRPENILYGPIAVIFLIKRKDSLKKDGLFPGIALFILCSALVFMSMASGFSDTERASVFTIETRPGFGAHYENIRANLSNNLLYFGGLGGIFPVSATILFLLGIGAMTIRRHCPVRGWLIAGWWGFFYLVLSIFPFGDFANRHSLDAWRFALHPCIPLTLGAAYGCCAAVLADCRLPVKRIITVTLLCILVWSPFNALKFFRQGHPHHLYFNALKNIKGAIPKDAVIIAQDPETVLMARYATGMPAYLTESSDRIININSGKRRLLLFAIDAPSDEILENYDLEPFISGSQGKCSYAAYFLKRVDSP